MNLLEYMKVSLNIYEFKKLDAIINGVCLSVLFVLYVLFMKSKIPSVFVLLLAVPILIIISMVIAFLWSRKAERTLLEGDVKFLNVRPIAMSLFFSLACLLTGVLAIAIYANSHIASLMIIVLSGYFGTNLGNIVKFVFRYSKDKE